MARGRGGKFKGPRKPRAGPGEEEDDGSEEEANYKPSNRGLGGQSSNVGMLPPSDDEEEEEGEEKEKEKPKPAAPAAAGSSAGRAAAPAARKPADDDDDDDDDEDSDDDDEDSDDGPVNDYLTAPRQPKKQETAERDAETIRKDLERLELIRKKREEDRLKRIRDEGWDRFAPVSDTNRPPGSVPTDHPSAKS